MIKTKITQRNFIKETRPMIGKSITHAWRGEGTAIFLEVGTLRLENKSNNPQGEFSFMFDCDWRIEKLRAILVGSSSTHAHIEKQVNNLIGRRVMDIGLFGALPEIIITLASNIRVLSFETYDKQPSWGLRLPDGRWLGSRDGTLTQETNKLGGKKRNQDKG